MIGIIGAMEIEVNGFIAEMAHPVEETHGGVTFTRGVLCGQEVVTAVCGVGKVNAAMRAQAMILCYKPDLIINTGVGGALSPDLRVGDVAVATAVVQHDMDTTPIGEPRGFLSGAGLGCVELPCDKTAADGLLASLSALGIRCLSGVIASGDQFIASVAQKKDIVSLFPAAVVCEMEGGSIGQVCRVNGVPFAVVRAVSDTADGGASVDFPQFAAESAKRSIAAVEQFLRQEI